MGIEDVDPVIANDSPDNVVIFICAGDDAMRCRIALKWRISFAESKIFVISDELPTGFSILSHRNINTINCREAAVSSIIQKPNDILISVVIPAYNASRYLETCLKSLIQQSLGRMEFLLINDGSDDNTLEIMQLYAHKDSRFKVIDIPHSGVGMARNVGVNNAQGHYIGFVDADDAASPIMFESLYRMAIESNADITVCRARSMDDSGEVGRVVDMWNNEPGIFTRERIESCDFLNNICSPVLWDKLIKREIALACPSPSLKRGQDFVALISMVNKAKLMRISDEELYYYRHHSDSNMNKPISVETIQDDARTEAMAISLIEKFWKGTNLEKEYKLRTANEWNKRRESHNDNPNILETINNNLPECLIQSDI